MATKKKKAGRPIGPKTTMINFRIPVTDKIKLQETYNGELVGMFRNWYKDLLKWRKIKKPR